VFFVNDPPRSVTLRRVFDGTTVCDPLDGASVAGCIIYPNERLTVRVVGVRTPSVEHAAVGVDGGVVTGSFLVETRSAANATLDVGTAPRVTLARGVCAAGFTGHPRSGLPCVACAAGTFKALNGSDACVSCPDETVVNAGRSACLCRPGHVFEDFVPRVRCSGPCPCTESVGVYGGTIVASASSSYGNSQHCEWIISSGSDPRVMLSSLDTEEGYDFVSVEACDDAACKNGSDVLFRFSGAGNGTNPSFQSNKRHLRIRFTTDLTGTRGGFTATWDTTKPPSECEREPSPTTSSPTPQPNTTPEPNTGPRLPRWGHDPACSLAATWEDLIDRKKYSPALLLRTTTVSPLWEPLICHPLENL
jgi:hypothetical protein